MGNSRSLAFLGLSGLKVFVTAFAGGPLLSSALKLSARSGAFGTCTAAARQRIPDDFRVGTDEVELRGLLDCEPTQFH